MKSDNTERSSFIPRYIPKTFDIWALGITVVIGGQYFSWNFGLVAGFGSFTLATIIIALQYICLVLCTSEISSALPFAGGAYGLARCTLGFYPGFIVGCCESLEYIIYVALSVVTLGSMMTLLFNTPVNFQPLYWMLFYCSALAIQNQRYGGALFWRFVYTVAIVSLVIILIYCFGSLPFVNISEHVQQSGPLFTGGMMGFMQILPIPAWFFVGIESLPFTCDVVADPKKSIGRGAISCILTLTVTALFVLFVSSALPPASDGVDLSASPFPLNQGFSLMFRCSANAVMWLSLPATYATAFGFIYGYGKILCSMAKSKLLPDIFGINTNNTPFYAMSLGSTVSILVCFLIFYWPQYASSLYGLCMLSGFVGYFSQCIGYVCMRTKFQNISREFHSPIGIAGACYTGAVSVLGVISIIGFQQDHYFAICGFIGSCSLFSVYYFFVAKNKQTFSPDEQKIMFVAHVVNFNGHHRQRKPKPLAGSNKSGSSIAGSIRSGTYSAMSFTRKKLQSSRVSSLVVVSHMEDCSVAVHATAAVAASVAHFDNDNDVDRLLFDDDDDDCGVPNKCEKTVQMVFGESSRKLTNTNNPEDSTNGNFNNNNLGQDIQQQLPLLGQSAKRPPSQKLILLDVVKESWHSWSLDDVV